MPRYDSFYIDGVWTDASTRCTIEVINPAEEESLAQLALGEADDVDNAVAAARRAFPDFAQTSKENRLALLSRIIAGYEARAEDLAQAVSQEMGAPITLARQSHVVNGLNHLLRIREILAEYRFDQLSNGTMVSREPIGVCGLITPWNWPLNQIAVKVGPALAAGCTMVLKPSELAPGCALILAEILDAAEVPAGVFNLVNGTGATVGAALAAHRGVDMISFTGSTRAGIAVAKAAADTVKRVTQELGGKSGNVLLPDADFETAVSHGARACFLNAGQSCNAPTRLIVPMDRMAEAAAIAGSIAVATAPSAPSDPASVLGPLAGCDQFEKVQALIGAGIDEGATLVAGGLGRPEGIDHGYFVRPTVFAGVTPGMRIAEEEIFGPVLVIMPYRDEVEAVEIANATDYGLSSYVSSSNLDRARAVARRMRAGMVHINGARSDNAAPFGGYKHSGNGREWGSHGFEEFLELKSMFGYKPTP